MRARPASAPSATAPTPWRCRASLPTASTIRMSRTRWIASASCSTCGAPPGSDRKTSCRSASSNYEQVTGLVAQQDAKAKELGFIDQELAGVRDLWQRNLVQLNRLTSLERDEAKIQGERGALIANAAEAKGRIAEIQLQILQIDQQFTSDVAKELRETD